MRAGFHDLFPVSCSKYLQSLRVLCKNVLGTEFLLLQQECQDWSVFEKLDRTRECWGGLMNQFKGKAQECCKERVNIRAPCARCCESGGSVAPALQNRPFSHCSSPPPQALAVLFGRSRSVGGSAVPKGPCCVSCSHGDPSGLSSSWTEPNPILAAPGAAKHCVNGVIEKHRLFYCYFAHNEFQLSVRPKSCGSDS